jgi:hypothetical protein
MRRVTRISIRWLNVLVIVALLGSLLPPPPPARANTGETTTVSQTEPLNRPARLPGELVFNGTFNTTITGWSNSQPHLLG